jgi:hypothetical protein
VQHGDCQAAGVCATLSARTAIPPRFVDYADVRAELLRQGADLGQDEPQTTVDLRPSGTATREG